MQFLFCFVSFENAFIEKVASCVIFAYIQRTRRHFRSCMRIVNEIRTTTTTTNNKKKRTYKMQVAWTTTTDDDNDSDERKIYRLKLYFVGIWNVHLKVTWSLKINILKRALKLAEMRARIKTARKIANFSQLGSTLLQNASTDFSITQSSNAAKTHCSRVSVCVCLQDNCLILYVNYVMVELYPICCCTHFHLYYIGHDFWVSILSTGVP